MKKNRINKQKKNKAE
ncbi:hypothetical protein [Plasmodium yoelii yoelii]|uniref:Uncharacterized protein n=1 Tax=Plasmodium yoelii yoelii TaxID=73239 RepID=Q7RE60_PLAYO|nr:hypothetical protein [Plasmodium yoelii yoelii]